MAARPGRPSSTSCSNRTGRSRARVFGDPAEKVTLHFGCADRGSVAVRSALPGTGARADNRRLRDNHDPRGFPNRIWGVAKHAWDAHLNSFGSLPGFAAAVIIAHMVHTPQNLVDALAAIWSRPCRLRGVLPGEQSRVAFFCPVHQPRVRAGYFRCGRSGVSDWPDVGAG